MSYGQVLKRAWKITLRWEVLWVLAFLIGLSRGWPQASNRIQWIVMIYVVTFLSPYLDKLLDSLCPLAVLVGTAFGVLATISRGALIGGVRQVEEKGSTALGQAWRVGVRHFWTLLSISVLTTPPIIVVGIIVVGAFLWAPFIVASGGGGSKADTVFTTLCCVPFCCGAILVSILLSQIQTYADRAAVLEDLGCIAALRRGWQVFKDNLGHTLVFLSIFLAIGLALFVAVGGGIRALTLPFWRITKPVPEMQVPIICMGLLTVIASALIGAIVQTFTSVTWTLAYRRMTGLEAPQEL